ncbi:hypothetical protein PZA11_005930 [Diplocarpon coronariae]
MRLYYLQPSKLWLYLLLSSSSSTLLSNGQFCRNYDISLLFLPSVFLLIIFLLFLYYLCLCICLCLCLCLCRYLCRGLLLLRGRPQRSTQLSA